MDILLPTRYDGQVNLGGSTKPWSVFATVRTQNEDPVEVAYIVKVFSNSNVSQHPCIAKEFICNLLASEFDLFVPKPGIINLNSVDFKNTLPKKERRLLKEKFQGNTYASQYLNGVLVNEQVKNSFTDIEARAMIYAFDCFILNIDRWGFRKKANLLIHNDEFLLIDHELSLSFIDKDNPKAIESIFKKIKSGGLFYQFQKHLFYESLKNYTGKKENMFDTFAEYLINLNVNRVRNLLIELNDNAIDTGFYSLLFDYIREMKHNIENFCDALLKTIK